MSVENTQLTALERLHRKLFPTEFMTTEQRMERIIKLAEERSTRIEAMTAKLNGLNRTGE